MEIRDADRGYDVNNINAFINDSGRFDGLAKENLFMDIVKLFCEYAPDYFAKFEKE